jgi:hypothetical protein
MAAMRDHATIVRDYGAQNLARLLNSAGFVVHASTPQRWADRSSIPGEYWAIIADRKLASLEELAAAADKRSNAPDRAAA